MQLCGEQLWAQFTPTQLKVGHKSFLFNVFIITPLMYVSARDATASKKMNKLGAWESWEPGSPQPGDRGHHNHWWPQSASR